MSQRYYLSAKHCKCQNILNCLVKQTRYGGTDMLSADPSLRDSNGVRRNTQRNL